MGNVLSAAAKGTGLAALADAATGKDDSGMGIAFPLLLALIVVLAGSYAVARVRRS